MPKYKSGDQRRLHYGEPADREAEQLLERQAIAPGTSGDPNDSMDDFALVRDVGEPWAKAASRQSQQAKPWTSRAKPEQQAADDKIGATEAAAEGVSVEDFYAYMPMHSYIYAPTREMWPAPSVNARVPPPAKGIKTNLWLDQHRPVEQMTWAPGLPMLIKNKLISEGGWTERSGVTCFNFYKPPIIEPGHAAKAGLWLDHMRKVFGAGAEHILKWLAHRVQRPADKINHALVLGGAQGIGKDTLLEPVKRAIGSWNFTEVGPQQALGRFNGFLKSVILRISEARDLGDLDRFSFYDHMKSYIVAPPDVLRVDEKHIREHSVLNCTGIIITTNHKTDGIYLPSDDRRHFVAWSDLTKEQFDPDYWTTLWAWYRQGGDRHVGAYLRNLDLASFNPKAPPPKTQAFWEIVDASRAPEDAELADVIDSLGSPAALTLAKIAGCAQSTLPSGFVTENTSAVFLTGLKPAAMSPSGTTPPRMVYGRSTASGR